MSTERSTGDFWCRRRVLVTGAYGFLGAHLVRALLDRGAAVVGLVHHEPAECYLKSEGLDQRVDLVRGDVAEEELLAGLLPLEEISVVFHLAAQAIVGAAVRSPLPTFETNIRGTYVLLEAARLAWNEGKGCLAGVVVASSDKAYGPQAQLPYTEDMPLLARAPYDASKACADLLTRAFSATYGLPAAVTRCANLYGPGDVNWSRLVPGMMRWIIEGRRPIIRSDGTPQRDYLFVGDAVTGYLTLAEQLGRPEVRGQAFNVGTGEPVSVLDFVREIVAASGQSALEPEVLGEAAGEIPHQYLDSTKAREVLGWCAVVPRAEGLRQTYDWYRAALASAGRER
jgi:CDP-glucose 4,6-dehydratase